MRASVPLRAVAVATVAMSVLASCSDDVVVDLSAPLESISAGLLHTCGLATDGTAYCWGWNRDGQLGDGNNEDRATPIQVQGNGRIFVAIEAGGGHTCALAGDGAAHCWGFNMNGQLGDGSATSRSTPAPVSGTLQFATLTVGSSHACGVTTGQAAYCWGWNGEGQLGDGSGADQSVPVPVAGGLSFAMLSAGSFHTCGVTTTGDAYCWGRGGSGQLGAGASGDRDTPVLVEGGFAFAAVTVGLEHSCGILTGGDVWCWGRNDFGQLGINSTVQQTPQPAPLSGGMTFADVNGGALFTCGVTTGAQAFCWGFNQSGQGGTNDSQACVDAQDGTSVACNLAPVPVEGGLSFTSVTSGTQHTCGIATGSIAYCWGSSSEGQLGDGSSGQFALSVVPVRVAGQM